MENDRFTERATKEQVAAKVHQLRDAWREAAIVVEPGFADGHDLRSIGQFEDRQPGRVIRAAGGMRMDAGRRIDVRSGGQLDRLTRRLEVPPGNQYTLNTGLAGGIQHRQPVDRERVRLKVAM